MVDSPSPRILAKRPASLLDNSSLWMAQRNRNSVTEDATFFSTLDVNRKFAFELGQPWIGIDLGTTQTQALIWNPKDDKTLPVLSETGDTNIPTNVAYESDGSVIAGEGAHLRRSIVRNSKSFIARDSSAEDVLEMIRHEPLAIQADEKGSVQIFVKEVNRSYYPHEIMAQVLAKVYQLAEKQFGTPVKKAVITIPAKFTSSQKDAIKSATNTAGFDCRYMIEEPVAATIAHFSTKKGSIGGQENKVIVFDLGGAALCVSILNRSDGIVGVETYNYCQDICGNVLDKLLYTLCTDHFEAENSIEWPAENQVAHQRL